MKFSQLNLVWILMFLLSCSSNVVTERYENGSLKTQAVVIEGKKNGSFKSYYENGNLKLEGIYKNDLREGEFLLYDSLGYLIQKGRFINGLKDGVFEDYFQDGNIKGIINYNSGKLDGESVGYFENGDIKFQTYFEDDSIVFFEEYNNTGELVDWKMDFNVEHDILSSEDHVLTIKLNKNKFSGVRVDLEIFEKRISKETLIAEIQKSNPGNIVDFHFDPSSLDSTLIIRGKVMQIEIIDDTQEAIIKKIEGFEREITIGNNDIKG